MATILLVNKADFTPYFQISEIGNDSKMLDPYIRQAQDLDIMPALGNAFFTDLLENNTATNYVNLLDGLTYTYSGNSIAFAGLKVAIVHYAMARRRLNANAIDTAWGYQEKTSEYSTSVSANRINQLAEQARSAGAAYFNQCVGYLGANPSLFPLYSSGCGSSAPKAGIRISGVDRFGNDNYNCRNDW